jgi:hypothetical protein
MILNPSSPHENEYLAAIAGLGEQTQSPANRVTYAIGDTVSGRWHDGTHWTGKVIWIDDDGMLAVESQGSWHRHWPREVIHAEPSAITH